VVVVVAPAVRVAVDAASASSEERLVG